MRLFLFGGSIGDAEENVQKLLYYFENIFNNLEVDEILHIPFARTDGGREAWEGDWFNRNIKLNKARYFNAKNEKDIVQVTNPLILISGGRQSANLLDKIKGNPLLLKLIQNAQYIVAESAGAKILGEYVRVGNDKVSFDLVKGLGIVKDTIIEPHYFEKNREGLLESEMKEASVKYGLGIDSMSGVEFELDEFPYKYNKLGNALFEIIEN
jgi:hypothetical protein